MNDMAAIIIAKSDQINAGDLVGINRTVRVAGVSVNAGTEQPVSIKVDGDTKVYRPCKSMSRVLVAAWGADSSKFVGRSMTLYNDPDVLWAGMKVGGIRISHMSHIDKPITLALAENKKNRKLFTVQPLRAASPAASLPEAAVAPPQPSAEQSSGAAPTEGASKAAEWAESFIAKVNVAPDREALMAVQLKAEKALAKLDENEPTLYALAVAAIKTRLAELDANDASDGGDEFAVEGAE